MNDKAQMLLAALLNLYGHMSRVCLYGLRDCIIKNGVDDASSLVCERKIIRLRETIKTGAQNPVFSHDFSNIKPHSPSLNTMLSRTQDETGFASLTFQVLA